MYAVWHPQLLVHMRPASISAYAPLAAAEPKSPTRSSKLNMHHAHIHASYTMHKSSRYTRPSHLRHLPRATQRTRWHHLKDSSTRQAWMHLEPPLPSQQHLTGPAQAAALLLTSSIIASAAAQQHTQHLAAPAPAAARCHTPPRSTSASFFQAACTSPHTQPLRAPAPAAGTQTRGQGSPWP